MRFGSLFYYHMREKGIHIQEGFPCFLTTAHSQADIEQIIKAFQESITEMQADGMLPGVGTPAAEAVPPDSTRQRDDVSSPTTMPERVEIVRESPLTEVQMEVWLSTQLSDEASCAYNESLTLHLHGVLNEAALRDSVQDIIARHDALRVTFTPTGDRQKFTPKLELEIPLVDLSSLNPTDRNSKSRELKDAEARTPFDLVNGPVARFKLVRLTTEHHALFFTAHHIVCDGWSTNVILDELGKLYSSKVSARTPELPLPLSFGAYAKSRDKKTSSDLTHVEKYWLEQFSELPPDLDLPTDRPRPAVRSFEGATYRRKISADAYKSVKRAGAKRGCTLFVTLLAGFQALLSRLSRQNDIVVGIPTAEQSLLDGQTLVGHCVNFLPLRARISDQIKFADLLSQQKKSLLDAYEHQTYTYGTLVRKLALRRGSSRLPLMEVQFNLERVGTDSTFTGLQAEVDPNPKAFVNFDLFLNVVESENGLVLDCDYNTGLYDETTIARWLTHYETLLLGFVADADQTVQCLPVLTEAEKREILDVWNATEADYPRNQCVHELFEAQARRTPEAVAVAFDNRRLTYGELNQKANQLANHLLKVGTGRAAVVGIYMDRSQDMMVALLGVLKSGAAYLPLDPSYPKERIDFIVGEAEVPVLLTQSHLASTLPHTEARIICLDSDWPLIARESSTKPTSRPTPEDLAYLIYTSGSTGKPKGVEVPHCAVVNLLWSMSRVPGMDATDTMLAVTTLSFDIAALELFLPLCVGGRLVITSREVASDPVLLMTHMVSCGATIMQATPVTWRMLLEAGWDGRPLRKMLCGGEALPRELADRLLNLPASLWNMYGPTETTIWSATGQVQRGLRTVIGPPIANTQFYVLDARNQPVPIGVPGELCISGDGVARDYFKRSELTAERFVANPFRPGTRMYKTGDLVRYLPDGTIDFVGRLDHQIKLRGFRIELGEIESVLSQHADVGHAVAMVREDSRDDQRLVAYLVPKNGRIPTTSELRSFAAEKLPDYMIPSAFMALESLPLTASGKIDRQALPKPDPEKSVRDQDFVSPTPNEKTMARIWSEVLKLERVSVQDNILELGADSIHIFQITARANEAGILITAKQLLQRRTIANLCSAIGASESEPGARDGVRIKRVSREAYRVQL
jgi:amino acid adenylation domain-containing protein